MRLQSDEKGEGAERGPGLAAWRAGTGRRRVQGVEGAAVGQPVGGGHRAGPGVPDVNGALVVFAVPGAARGALRWLADYSTRAKSC